MTPDQQAEYDRILQLRRQHDAHVRAELADNWAHRRHHYFEDVEHAVGQSDAALERAQGRRQ